MKIVDLDQGSQEWLDWRKTHLTATDAPMLLGASPYCTPYKGWQRKLGLAQEQAVNSAMLRGHADEPIVRKMFVEKTGIDFHPCCITSGRFPFLAASLDGISSCGKYIIEIKSNGAQYHFGLEDGSLPEFHMMQIQHQLLCTDGQVEKAYYLSYNNGDLKIIEVLPDQSFFEKYIPEAKKFWDRIIFFDAPPMTNKDYREIDNVIFSDIAEEYRNVCEQIKKLEALKETHRKKLIEMCQGESSIGGGVKVMKKVVRGRVCYDDIPELKSVNLEEYRGSPSESWTIFIDKK